MKCVAWIISGKNKKNSNSTVFFSKISTDTNLFQYATTSKISEKETTKLNKANQIPWCKGDSFQNIQTTK